MGNDLLARFKTNPSPENMDKVIDLARFQITDEEIADLSTILAKSGECLNFSGDIISADIPSTGGLGSLSTLITPLVLVQLGFNVPKLGIVGQPAGGIDVLYQIPGYNIFFNPEEVITCLKTSNYCHFLVGEVYAPLDALLFRYRATVGAKAIPSLVIASILSKKIAAGLRLAGLDVRVSEIGNFGRNWLAATENSRRFIKVANSVGIKATCFLSDFNILQQPYIGRGESLIALNNIFDKTMESNLTKHLYQCVDMAVALKSASYSTANFPLEVLKTRFSQNLEAQGSSMKKFYEKNRCN